MPGSGTVDASAGVIVTEYLLRIVELDPGLWQMLPVGPAHHQSPVSYLKPNEIGPDAPVKSGLPVRLPATSNEAELGNAVHWNVPDAPASSCAFEHVSQTNTVPACLMTGLKYGLHCVAPSRRSEATPSRPNLNKIDLIGPLTLGS